MNLALYAGLGVGVLSIIGNVLLGYLFYRSTKLVDKHAEISYDALQRTLDNVELIAALKQSNKEVLTLNTSLQEQVTREIKARKTIEDAFKKALEAAGSTDTDSAVNYWMRKLKELSNVPTPGNKDSGGTKALYGTAAIGFTRDSLAGKE